MLRAETQVVMQKNRKALQLCFFLLYSVQLLGLFLQLDNYLDGRLTTFGWFFLINKTKNVGDILLSLKKNLQKFTTTKTYLYTVPKEINCPRYNMKGSGENLILRGIFHVVSCFPIHLMLYRGNLDYYSDSVRYTIWLKLFENFLAMRQAHAEGQFQEVVQVPYTFMAPEFKYLR